MEQKTRKWSTFLSIICLIAGVALWLPNLMFQHGYGCWLLTLAINPLGALFGFLGKSKLGLISNIIMAFSFFLIMFFGYLFLALFG